jgi:hypothetical protein
MRSISTFLLFRAPHVRACPATPIARQRLRVAARLRRAFRPAVCAGSAWRRCLFQSATVYFHRSEARTWEAFSRAGRPLRTREPEVRAPLAHKGAAPPLRPTPRCGRPNGGTEPHATSLLARIGGFQTIPSLRCHLCSLSNTSRSSASPAGGSSSTVRIATRSGIVNATSGCCETKAPLTCPPGGRARRDAAGSRAPVRSRR